MQTKTFYFIGSAENSAIDVGMKPSAIYHGSGINGLRIVAHNIPAKATNDVDRVEIIIRGEEEQIVEFYKFVKSTDIRRYKKGSRPEVTELNAYSGKEPDWNYCITSTIHEQIYKGFEVLEQLLEVMRRFETTAAKNRREDIEREEKNRREDQKVFSKIQSSIDEQVRVSNKIQSSIDEQVRVSNKIQSSIDEQVRVSNKIQSSIDEQVRVSNKIQSSIDEQVRVSNKIQSSIDEQGRIADMTLAEMKEERERSDKRFEKIFATQAEIIMDVKAVRKRV